ncbi:MAG TPA: AAA family ATPase [Tepidisphaeraceae bacterium]|jgi:hypothetical protein
MTFQFAPAKREQVSLLIALAGASGSGKTYSALRLARGMVPSGKIAFIDTEARRGLHYAEEFDFLHSDMRPPFAPVRFMEGIAAAEAAGAEVVIIDSFSHEHDGIGGLIDWADRLAADGVKLPGNWKEPKSGHKKLMNALLQCRASIIFCLRADEKIEILRENGKTVVRPLGWMPICEKRFMFEMTASFTLTPDRPGIPHFDLPHKLQQQHRAFFPEGKPISEESGRMLAEWARGGSPAPAVEVDVTDDLMQWDSKLATAALQGTDCLRETWATVPKPLKKSLEAALRNRHQPTAEKVPV